MPPKFDPREIQKRAALRARAAGLPPPEVLPRIIPGAVFHVPDDSIYFADAPPGAPATEHASRRAIVVQCLQDCQAPRPLSLLVVPCSASHRGEAGPYALELPKGEPGFTADRVVAYAHLVQPIRKLRLEDWAGQLTPETLQKLKAVLARTLGLIPDAPSLDLSPRTE